MSRLALPKQNRKETNKQTRYYTRHNVQRKHLSTCSMRGLIPMHQTRPYRDTVVPKKTTREIISKKASHTHKKESESELKKGRKKNE